jgi:hypothetical protein
MEENLRFIRDAIRKNLAKFYHKDEQALLDSLDKITALEAKLKAAEEKLALSVPFEGIQTFCGKCSCDYHIRDVGLGCNCADEAQDNCPLIPNPVKAEKED